MTYLSQIYLHRNHILHFTDNIILRCIREAYRRSSKPEEPDFVAMLTTLGAPDLHQMISVILAPIGMSCTTTGVFCHQTPKVRYGSGTVCELGDILLVHIHTKGGKVIHRNSLLLQAKMASIDGSKSGYVIPPAEQHQLMLYSQWPTFEYYRSGPTLNGEIRNVFPHLAHPGAQYLLIDPSDNFKPGHSPPHGAYPCAVWMAQPVLYSYQNLSDIILGLFNFSTGRVFGPRSAKSYGWTRVVWDLLESSLKKTYNRRNIKVTDEDRMAGSKPDELLFFYKGHNRKSITEDILGTANLLNSNYPGDDNGLPPNANLDTQIDDDGGNVSVLMFETYEE